MQKRKLAEFVESYFEEATECYFCGEPAKYKCCYFLFCDECRRRMIGELKNPQPERKVPPLPPAGYRYIAIAPPPLCQVCDAEEADFCIDMPCFLFDICKECAQEMLECLKYAKDVSVQIRRTAKERIERLIAEAKRCPTAELYIKQLKSRLIPENQKYLDEEGSIEFWAAVQERAQESDRCSWRYRGDDKE